MPLSSFYRSHFLFALWIACASASGQSDRTPWAESAAPDNVYQGVYRLGDTGGSATFKYIVQSGDTVPDGAFLWEGVPAAGLSAQPIQQSRYQGNYRAGQPEGQWEITLGEFRRTGAGRVADYRYHVDLCGKEWSARGNLVDGRPEGKWTHTAVDVVNSQAGEVIYRSEFNFAEGTPVRDFKLESEGENVLLGRFDRAGRAEDAWTFYEDLTPTHVWVFEAGLLRRVDRIRQADTTSVLVFDRAEVPTKLVNLDADYLRAVAVHQAIGGRSGQFAQGKVAKLLRQNAEAFQRTSEAFASLGAHDFAPVFRVVLPDRTLAAGQQKALDRIAGLADRTQAIVSQLLDESKLTLASQADEEAAFAVAALRSLEDLLLPPLATLAADHRAGVLTTVPLSEYLGYAFPEGAAAGAMDVGYDYRGEQVNRAFTGPGARDFEVASGGLGEVEALAQYTLASAQSIRETLRKRVTSKERRRVVMALEEQVTYEFGLLDSLIRVQDRKTVKQYNLGQIRELARSEINAYANLEEGLDEDAQATRVITCLEAYEALTVALIDLGRRQSIIEARYTEEVWNNFTSTLMEERVKRRLIDAYLEELLPYFRASATEPLTCDSAAKLHYEIVTTHERMAKLRGQDTEELESALRGEDDPRTILQLIGVTPAQ